MQARSRALPSEALRTGSQKIWGIKQATSHKGLYLQASSAGGVVVRGSCEMGLRHVFLRGGGRGAGPSTSYHTLHTQNPWYNVNPQNLSVMERRRPPPPSNPRRALWPTSASPRGRGRGRGCELSPPGPLLPRSDAQKKHYRTKFTKVYT